MENTEIFINLLLGLSLATAVGFKIFIPFLIMSLAANFGYFDLFSDFEWIGTFPALITFGIASIFELVAYLIPFVDNILDTIANTDLQLLRLTLQ